MRLAVVDEHHLEHLVGQRLVVDTQDGRRLEGRLVDVRFAMLVLDQVEGPVSTETLRYRDLLAVSVLLPEAVAS